MIELLIHFIQDRGFTVDVLEGRILIRKMGQEQLYSIGWAIPKWDLRPEFEDYLYLQANRYMEMIDHAITKSVPTPQPERVEE